MIDQDHKETKKWPVLIWDIVMPKTDNNILSVDYQLIIRRSRLRFIYICIVLISFGGKCFSQSYIEQLQTTLTTMDKSPAKVDSLLKLSSTLYDVSQEQSLQSSHSALKMSLDLEYDLGHTKALNNLVTLHSNLGRKDSTLFFINLFVRRMNATSDSLEMVRGLSYAGSKLNQYNINERALIYLIKAVRIAERNDFYEQSIITYNRLANLVVTQDLQSGIKYLERALEIAENQNYIQHIGGLAVNLSILHDSIPLQKYYIDKAIVVGEKTQNEILLSTVYSKKADMLQAEEKYDDAILYELKSRSILPPTTDNIAYRATRTKSLGDLYLKTNQYQKAQESFSDVLRYFQKDSSSWAYFSSLYGLSIALHEQGKSQLAFDSLRTAYDLANNYYRQTTDDNLQELNKKFEVVEKENQLSQQALTIANEKNKRSRLLLLSLCGFALFSISFLLYFLNLRRRRLKEQHQLELKQIEAQSLKELNAMKSRWFENLSHDIRTPLTLISAPIKDVLKNTKSSTTQNLLQIADRNSQHLLQLTNQMLELARLENSVMPLHNQTKPVAHELNKIIHAFDSFASEKQVQIEANIKLNTDLTLSFDYDKYEKIFNNLFKNAIQYSPSNSQVKVDIDYINNKLVTKITNKGQGIPADELPHIFSKYFRANHHQSKLIEGSGLGLSIVKELVDLLSGEIHVESQVDQGTTFLYSIPVVKGHAHTNFLEVPTSQDSTQTNLLSSSEARILIVEDNDEMRNYLSIILSNHYAMDQAENGLEAIQKLESQQYDLIISDIMMPKLDGFNFKKRVNMLSDHQRIPFIFLSAKALDVDKIQGLNLGVDDYVTKPFVTDELLIRIKNLLARKTIRQAEHQKPDPDDSNDKATVDSFVDQAYKIVMREIQNQDFGVDHLARELLYSQRQLSRILKKETGLSTVQFILEVRLQHARKLLLSNEVYSVKEVQNQVGILSQSYFSKKYAERFGLPPGATSI